MGQFNFTKNLKYRGPKLIHYNEKIHDEFHV